jgi:hypothetical protein
MKLGKIQGSVLALKTSSPKPFLLHNSCLLHHSCCLEKPILVSNTAYIIKHYGKLYPQSQTIIVYLVLSDCFATVKKEGEKQLRL